jgi:hypothetical protein
MNPDEMQDLARAMETVPGLKGIDHQDVRRLAKLLKENPEIGSIELKGFFGTGVVISRTRGAERRGAGRVCGGPGCLEAERQSQGD